MEQKKTLTCADCVVIQCHVQNKQYPSFCLTENMDQQIKQEAMAQYQDSQNQNIMITAADIEYEGYGKWPRVQEIIEFAKRMGFHKIGIATCVGLLHETRVFAKILRSHGFEVYGIGCKTGAVPKTEVEIGRAHV